MMINRRRVMCVGSCAPASYITDGMIAWYDGEWNRDIGVHDPSATTWVNLADNGRDITQIDNRFTWGDKYLLPPVIEKVGNIPSFNEARTIEAVLIFIGTGFLPVINYTDNKYGWIALRGNDTVNFGQYGPCAPCPRGQLVSISGVGVNVSYNTSTNKLFINGTDKKGGSGATGDVNVKCFNSTFSWGSGTAYFYCLRFYNRELTDEEVLYNYNIDKERYGL